MTQQTDAQTWLLAAREGKLNPPQLFQRLAAEVPGFFTAFAPDETGKSQPILTIRHQDVELVSLFTDRESARPTLADRAGSLTEYPALKLLQALIRRQAQGVVINPGVADLKLSPPLLHLLFREYAIHEFGQAGGAWAPTKDGVLLVLAGRNGVNTLPVYLNEKDADSLASQTGGKAEFHSWSVIRARSMAMGTDGVTLQQGLPETANLPRPHVARLSGEGPDPVEEVERAVVRSVGKIPAAALWPMLARVDRIWWFEDEVGEPARMGNALNLFTSQNAAERYMAEAKKKGKEVDARPRFRPAPEVFQWVASHGAQVAINPGLSPFWLDGEKELPKVIGGTGTVH